MPHFMLTEYIRSELSPPPRDWNISRGERLSDWRDALYRVQDARRDHPNVSKFSIHACGVNTNGDLFQEAVRLMTHQCEDKGRAKVSRHEKDILLSSDYSEAIEGWEEAGLDMSIAGACIVVHHANVLVPFLDAGFTIEHTGGGCMVMQRDFSDGWAVYLTDGDMGLPDASTTHYCIGLYDDVWIATGEGEIRDDWTCKSVAEVLAKVEELAKLHSPADLPAAEALAEEAAQAAVKHIQMRLGNRSGDVAGVHFAERAAWVELTRPLLRYTNVEIGAIVKERRK
jgi:hypothetical protein